MKSQLRPFRAVAWLAMAGFWLSGIGVFNSALGAEPAAPLVQGFRQPPDETKPWVYWYWITDNISREGITRDLEAMARVGIGEALIGNIYLEDVQRGSVKALTEEWWGLVEHAIREGGRLGVNIGMFNCPGWSQSGGPWIKPEQAMRYLVSAERRVTGPARFEGKLPAPKEPFQDISVLAFPAPRGDADTVAAHVPRVACTPAVGERGANVRRRLEDQLPVSVRRGTGPESARGGHRIGRAVHGAEPRAAPGGGRRRRAVRIAGGRRGRHVSHRPRRSRWTGRTSRSTSGRCRSGRSRWLVSAGHLEAVPPGADERPRPRRLGRSRVVRRGSVGAVRRKAARQDAPHAAAHVGHLPLAAAGRARRAAVGGSSRTRSSTSATGSRPTARCVGTCRRASGSSSAPA